MQTRTISKVLSLGSLLTLCACGSESEEPPRDEPNNGTAAGPAQGGSSPTGGGSSTAGSDGGGSTSTGGDGSSGSSTGGSATAGSSTGGGSSSEACAPDPAECTSSSALEKMALADFENGQGWFLFANPD